MKTKAFFSTVAVMAMFLAGGNLFATNRLGDVVVNGDSQTQLGEYAITELEPETIKGEALRKFELTYENGKAPITIYLNERSNCKDYIVRSNTMEVKYVCRKSGFGAQTLTGKFSVYTPEANAAFVSEGALENQGKICGGELDVNKALGLIACYYPALVKNISLL